MQRISVAASLQIEFSMRKDHRPYWVKKLQSRISAWYSKRYVYPAFDHLGKEARFLAPRSLAIHGAGITAGDYLHLISNPLNPIKMTTWQDKSTQGRITLGHYCLISPGVEMTSAASISVGNNCMIAADVMIHDSDWHGLYNRLRPFRCTKPVTLENNVWVGARAIILKGVTIGENAVVGAGSVVTQPVAANTVVAGNPARVIKTLNPNRRRLTREFLFTQQSDYWEQQDTIDAYFTLDNSVTHWLRTVIKPTNTD